MPEKLQTNNVGKKKRPIEVSDGQIRTNITHLFSSPCFVLSLYYPIFLYIVFYTLNYFIINFFLVCSMDSLFYYLAYSIF